MTHLTAKVLVMGIVAVSLAACSSGGGNKYTDTTTTVPSGSTKPTPQKNTEIKGNRLVLDATNGNKAGGYQSIAGASGIGSIVIDGKTVEFDSQGVNAGQIVHLASKNMARVGSGNGYLKDSRFGYAHEGGKEQVLFSQGKVTTNMPTSGKATYTGKAVHVDYGKLSVADAQFSVDYGKKQVAGTIKAASGNVPLYGEITGNKFSGNKNGVGTIGYFYGDNAAELGGIYQNTRGEVSGAYGAKREQ